MKTLNNFGTRAPAGQSGFTLIEIAIVLVIIGLLLGGVLQGQQLIENSRVKAAANDFNGISAGAFSYQDRYGRLPGDDPGAVAARGDSWSTVNTGNGDGSVNASLANTFLGTVGAGVEGADFFQHLKAAGFIAGDPALAGAQAQPQNAFGGLIGVTNAPMGATGVAVASLQGLKVCMNNVPGSGAIALDTQLDDGVGTTGRFRGVDISGGNAAPTDTGAAFNEDGIYTVCYRI